MITENKALYYEFILDEVFIFGKNNIPNFKDNISIDYLNKLNYYKDSNEKRTKLYHHLHEFINKKFNTGGIKLPANNDRAFIITNDENKINDCKEFCHYFVNNKNVFYLLMQQVDNENVFKSGLETIYNTLQLEKELHFNNGVVAKKPKL